MAGQMQLGLGAPRPLSVREVVAKAGRTLESQLGIVHVEGEICQVSRPSSGHLYFSLKDGDAMLPVVMWRTDAQRLKFELAMGAKLEVRGKLGIYAASGKFQLYATWAAPVGAGEAALALEALRQKLTAEGLFDPSRKRALPTLPKRIGVVTSKHGAALHDILRTIERRFPVSVLVADCLVQGDAAPAQIVAAIAAIAQTNVEVVIIGRGGGSAQDLAAFNHEAVVRAVAACPIPTIVAVGHEVDITMAELAGDLRASTPTAAAEHAVPVWDDLTFTLEQQEQRLVREWGRVMRTAREDLDRAEDAATNALRRRLHGHARELAALTTALYSHAPRAKLTARRTELGQLQARLVAFNPQARLGRMRAELVALGARADQSAQRTLRRHSEEYRLCVGKLEAFSPLRVLERGYAIATHQGKPLRNASAVKPGDNISVRLARGQVRCDVTSVQASPATGKMDGATP